MQVGALLLRARRELALEVPDAVIEQLIPTVWFRSLLDKVDRNRPVAEAEVDESFLRLVTRSIGPTTSSSVRRFFLRSLRFARRRGLHEDLEDPMELFEVSVRPAAEVEYFEKVKEFSDRGSQRGYGYTSSHE